MIMQFNDVNFFIVFIDNYMNYNMIKLGICCFIYIRIKLNNKKLFYLINKKKLKQNKRNLLNKL